MDHSCYLCLVFVMLSRLFITALWSPAGRGLISWLLFVMFKRSSVVDCLARDQGAAGSSLTGVTAFWSLSKTYFYPSLVLVQPRKTRPFLTEILLMGRKRIKSNKTNLIFFHFSHVLSWVRCGTWLYRFLIFAVILTFTSVVWCPMLVFGCTHRGST